MQKLTNVYGWILSTTVQAHSRFRSYAILCLHTTDVVAAAVFISFAPGVWTKRLQDVHMTTAFRMDFIVDVMFHLQLQNSIRFCVQYFITLYSIDRSAGVEYSLNLELLSSSIHSNYWLSLSHHFQQTNKTGNNMNKTAPHPFIFYYIFSSKFWMH